MEQSAKDRFRANLSTKNYSVSQEVQKLLLLHQEQQKTIEIQQMPSHHHYYEKYVGLSIYGFPIFDPCGPFCTVWTMIMQFIDATYCCFAVPIYLAFQITFQDSVFATAADFIIGPIFLVNLFLKFQMGRQSRKNYNLKKEMNGLKVAKDYVKNPSFYIDICSVIPFFVMIWVLVYPDQVDISILIWVHILRFPRALWFIKKMFTSSFSLIQRSSNLDNDTFFMMNVIFTTAVIVNFGACIWYGAAMISGLQNSWVHAHGIINGTKLRQYISSVYFALTVMTTTGFGDISAQTECEEIAAILLLILGVIMFAFIISTVSTYLTNISSKARRVQMFRSKMKKINWWSERRGLSAQSLKKLKNYYWEVWTRLQQESEREIFQEIPPHLKAIVAVELVGGLVHDLAAFRNLKWEQIYLLASRMTPQEVIAEHELFREGDEAVGIWVLEQGQLLASQLDGGEDIVNAPDIVGEALLWSPRFDKYCQTSVDSESDPVLRERFEVRRITYTATTTTQMWFLRVQDIITLAQVIPTLIDNIKESITQDLESQLLAEADIQTHKRHLIQNLQRTSKNLFQDYDASSYKPSHENKSSLFRPSYMQDEINPLKKGSEIFSQPKHNFLGRDSVIDEQTPYHYQQY